MVDKGVRAGRRGARPAVCGVTGPGTNMRERSGASGVDAKALPSSHNTDATGTRKSGQGEVSSRSPGSTPLCGQVESVVDRFRRGSRRLKNQWRHGSRPQHSCRPKPGRRCCETTKLGRVGGRVLARCLYCPRNGDDNRLLEPFRDEGNGSTRILLR